MARTSLLRSLHHLEIEEKILNGCALIAMVGVFLPWFGGIWYGEPTVWTGFGFYTSFVGLLIFLSCAFILAITILQVLGYQVMRSNVRDLVRLVVGLECVLMTIIVWSVLTNVAFQRPQMEIRFGIYLTLIGSIVVSLYAFLRVQQQRRRSVEELFHHPEESVPPHSRKPAMPRRDIPEPPPPPPPGSPHEPRLFS
jgi:hypothetical protein